MKKKVIGKDQGFKTKIHGDFIDAVSSRLTTPGEAIQEIPISKIRIKENVRKEYKGINEMAASIKEKGLQQPITVTPTADGYFEIVFGHRRFKGMCELNESEPEKWLKIKAIVKDEGSFDADEIMEIQLIENLNREDLTPLETKEALEHLRKKGYTAKKIASRLGKSEGYVKQLFSGLKALKNNPALQEVMKSDVNITFSDIHEIKVVPPRQQLELIERKISGEFKNVKELREAAFDLRRQVVDKEKSDRTRRVSQGCFVKQKNAYRIHLDRIDEASEEQKKELAESLKAILKKLEGFEFDSGSTDSKSSPQASSPQRTHPSPSPIKNEEAHK